MMKERDGKDEAEPEAKLTEHETEGYPRRHGGKVEKHHKRAEGGGIAGRAAGGAAPVAARKHGGGIHPNPNHRPGGGNRHPHHGRANGGAVAAAAAPAAARKRGGHVPGEEAERRPDRRARGGGVSDMNPLTTAGKMSKPSYERDQQPKADKSLD